VDLLSEMDSIFNLSEDPSRVILKMPSVKGFVKVRSEKRSVFYTCLFLGLHSSQRISLSSMIRISILLSPCQKYTQKRKKNRNILNKYSALFEV